MDFKRNMEKYVELILKVGLNIQKGDGIFVLVNEHSIGMVREVTKQAYKMGAKDVVYDFSDYKRPKGKLLAKEEFSIIRKLKIKPKSLTQEFNIDLEPVKGMQLIIILNVFNIEL